MSPKFGYLLPTREGIMKNDHSARSLIEAAKRAEGFGFDSVWAGDSLTARPRHDPLTLLAGVAAAVPRIEMGTAVLLPMLRNPVILAQQLATIDQISEGRLVVGAGIAADAPSVRAEFQAAGVPFEKRVGRMMEGFELCRALWSGQEVSWEGLWKVEPSRLAPVPHRPGGPPIWMASSVPVGIERAAKHYDGWFPIGPNPEGFSSNRQIFLEATKAAGRSNLTSAIYLTIAIEDDPSTADTRINRYLEDYYSVPANIMRQFQSCCGGALDDVLTFLRSYVEAGADHLVLRLVGDHEKMLSLLSQHRSEIIT